VYPSLARDCFSTQRVLTVLQRQRYYLYFPKRWFTPKVHNAHSVAANSPLGERESYNRPLAELEVQ